MKDFVAYIGKALVEHPEAVEVREVRGSETIVLELRTHPDDTGRVIGRNGRTIHAIRILLAATGTKIGKRFTLDVVSEAAQPQQDSRGRLHVAETTRRQRT
jgi:predicted RNA-binding protein YlqC (UPF0109 family)